MSAVNAIYHIVFNTYRREMTLPLGISDELYKYIAGIVNNNNSILYGINGIENHIHLLINLHPSVCLSDMIRDIKSSTSKWIAARPNLFPDFNGWGKEYGAFTYALRDREMVCNYIKNQRAHHKREPFEKEFEKLILNAGLEWNDFRLT